MLQRSKIVVLGLAALAATLSHAGIAVEGRVVSSGERPVADARVRLIAADGLFAAALREPDDPGRVVAEARTDGRGRYRVEAPQVGHYRMQIDAPGVVGVSHPLHGLLEPRELPAARLSSDRGLAVRVVDDDGAPVAGALVRLTSAPEHRRGPRFSRWDPAPRAASTDENGETRLPFRERDGGVLTASSPGLGVARQTRFRGNAVTLVLAAAPHVAVEVRERDGGPVAGALLALGATGHPLTFTDESGRVELPLDLDDPKLVVIEADGRTLSTRLKRSGGEEPQRLVLEPRADLSGRIIDALSRRPVAGAMVWDPSEPWSGVVTDDAGRFALPGTTGQKGSLAARAPGYLRAGKYNVPYGAGRPPTLVLEPAATVEGIVVDADGKPVAGAELSLAVKRKPGSFRIEISTGDSGPPTAVSSSRGRFRLTPIDPAGRYDLKTVADEFAQSETVLEGLKPYEVRTGFRIVLERGQRVVGRVVDLDGAPLADADVRLSPAKGGPRGGMMIVEAGAAHDKKIRGSSDADGRFEIGGLAAGKYDVEIRRRGFATRRAAAVELPAGEDETDLGDFALEPGERVQGRVLDPDGQPIEGVEIHARAAGPMFMVGGHGPPPEAEPPAATTGPDGWFTIEDQKRDSTIDVEAVRTGYSNKSRSGIPVPSPAPVEITMHPSSKVSGRVRDAEGNGIAGATVTLRRQVRRQMGGSLAVMISMEQAESDADGVYLFEGLEPGEIGLSAKAPEWQETTLDQVEIPAGEDLEDVDLVLDRGAWVEGRVIGPDDRPVVGASVRKVAGGDRMMAQLESGLSDGDGYYRVDGLAPGLVSIEAEHDDYPRVVRDVEVDPGINRLDLRFTGGQQIRGVVLDESGRPVPAAWVRVDTSGFGFGGPEASTDQDGAFELSGLKDGDYRLVAGAENHAENLEGVSVTVAGEPVVGVEIRLSAGAAIVGRVLGVEPEELADVGIDAQHGEVRSFRSGAPGHDGAYRLDDVRSGPWTVVARLGDTGRQARGQVTVEPGAVEATLDLEFGRGIVLSGRVEEGREPVVGASVFAGGEDVDRRGWGRTDPDGRFRIDGLENGRYEVEVRDWATGLSHDETIELGGNRDVTIRIPTASVAGVIVDAGDRQPLGGVAVTLERLDAPDSGLGRFFADHGATTDSEGKFRIDYIGQGGWRLTATKEGYAAATRALNVQRDRDLDDVRLSLDPTEGLSLQVTLSTGQPVDRARVAVRAPSGATLESGQYTAGESGVVRLRSVPPGSWDVLVSTEGAATARVRVAAPGGPHGVQLPPATALTVEVPELAGSGRVASVHLVGSNGVRYTGLAWFGATRDEWPVQNGRVEFRTLPPDTWQVVVSAGDGGRWQGTVTTSPAGPARLVLE